MFTSFHKVLGSPDKIYQHAFSTHGGFVQVYLPVHQPPGVKKILNTVNALFFNN
jgi:hypothetical protein